MTLIISWYDCGCGQSMSEYDGNNLKDIKIYGEDDEDCILNENCISEEVVKELVRNSIKSDDAKRLFNKYEHIIICENGGIEQIK